MASESLTIVDLAQNLGLSKTTVADALNGTGRVSSATRERVRNAAKAAGYVTNSSARRLRTRHGGTIALYVPPDIRDMEFYMGFAFGAVDAAGRHGYDLSLLTTTPATVSSWHVFHGVIVIDVLQNDPVLESLLDSNVPVVAAGHLDARASQHMNAVIAIDHAHECYRTLDALSSLSARYPALIGAAPRDETSWSSQVRDGYVRWAQEHGLDPVYETLPPFASNEELQHAIDSALANPGIDALLFGWQDAAERAKLVLAQPQYASRKLRLGAYASRTYVKAVSQFDVTLNLEPYKFGQATVETLFASLESGDAEQIVASYVPTISGGTAVGE